MEPIYGVWFPATGSKVLYSQEATIDAVNRVADAGFNTIFPNVWWQGYTLYPSTVMDERFGAAIKPEFQGRDPLADMVDAARQAGLRIIPWFEYGFIASYNAKGGHILAKYPHWAACDRHRHILPDKFDWMNGLHPEVQEFLISLFLEVADRYDIDGLQGDDHLSVPVKSGYDDYTIAAYRQDFDADPPLHETNEIWMRWRADRLTDFMAELSCEIKTRHPHLLFSMAPSEFPFSYKHFLVDYPQWLRLDIVDLIHPQLYHSGVSGYQSSADNAEFHLREEDLAKMSPGMAIEPNGQRFSSEDLWACIAYNRQLGIRGECIWVYEQLRKHDDELLKALKLNRFGDRKAHILLHQGMRGEDVKEIQALLKAKGYEVGLIDGVFGALTSCVVRQFQSDQGLLPDGVVGPQTYARLTR